MRARTLLSTLAVCLLPLTVSAGDGHDHDAHGDDHHKVEVSGLEVIHGWARATTSGATQVFMELHNETGAQITLHGAHVAGGPGMAVVMGAPVKAGGAPAPLGEFPLADGMAFEFDPEGVYLALSGLAAPLAQGDTLPLVLDLHPLGEVEIVIDVEAANATQHSHAGHMH